MDFGKVHAYELRTENRAQTGHKDLKPPPGHIGTSYDKCLKTGHIRLPITCVIGGKCPDKACHARFAPVCRLATRAGAGARTPWKSDMSDLLSYVPILYLSI